MTERNELPYPLATASVGVATKSEDPCARSLGGAAMEREEGQMQACKRWRRTIWLPVDTPVDLVRGRNIDAVRRHTGVLC